MFSSSEITRFKTICSSFGVDLSEGMIQKFETYASLLLEWNRRIHLVSRGDARSDRILRHFVDSLCIFKILDIPRNSSLLDLGSGAGFPGVPIKIVRNNVKMTLVESVRKKTLFLRKLIEVLNLTDISIAEERAETLAAEYGLLESFDFVTAKALGKLRNGIELSLPFLKIGGLLIAYKGRGGEREMKDTSLPADCRVKDVRRIKIPETNLLRWLVVIEKVA